MVKLASRGVAFIDPDQVGAFPDLVVFEPIASLDGGGNMRGAAALGSPLASPGSSFAIESVSFARFSSPPAIGDSKLCLFDDN